MLELNQTLDLFCCTIILKTRMLHLINQVRSCSRSILLMWNVSSLEVSKLPYILIAIINNGLSLI